MIEKICEIRRFLNILHFVFAEFPVCETGDHVEGSDPQNDKKKYPWLNFFIGDTFELLDSNQLYYIVKDSTNKVGLDSDIGLDFGALFNSKKHYFEIVS